MEANHLHTKNSPRVAQLFARRLRVLLAPVVAAHASPTLALTVHLQDLLARHETHCRREMAQKRKNVDTSVFLAGWILNCVASQEHREVKQFRSLIYFKYDKLNVVNAHGLWTDGKQSQMGVMFGYSYMYDHFWPYCPHCLCLPHDNNTNIFLINVQPFKNVLNWNGWIFVWGAITIVECSFVHVNMLHGGRQCAGHKLIWWFSIVSSGMFRPDTIREGFSLNCRMQQCSIREDSCVFSCYYQHLP